MNKFAVKTGGALAVLLSLTGTAKAVYVVDTGRPADMTVGSFAASIGSTPGGTISSAGVFSISSLTTISEIQGFMQVGGAGTLAVSLHAGSPAGPLLFSAHRAVVTSPSYPFEGVGISGLNWTVTAGTYAVTFGSPDGFMASMPWGAPTPLGEEWQGFNGNWSRFDQMNLGVRVSAVPEVAPHALLCGGLGLMFAMRIRRKV
jgi:hypothetical protein